jgi:hypothetical protein
MGEKSLSELQATESIRRLLSLYSDAVSRREPDEIARLFAPNAEVIIMDGDPRVGREAIVADDVRFSIPAPDLRRGPDRCYGKLG